MRFQIVQGDTAKICIHVEDADGNPIPNFSSYGLTFTLKRSTQDADSAAVFQGTKSGGDIVILGEATDGVCEVTIPAASTKNMRTYRPHYWSLQLKNGVDEPFTPVSGTMVTTPNPHE